MSLFDEDLFECEDRFVLEEEAYNFIETNYYVYPAFTNRENEALRYAIQEAPMVNGKLIVNWDHELYLKETAPSICNDVFEWGNVFKFSISYNMHLTDLQGSPKKAYYYNISDCRNLESLKGCPEMVDSDVCLYNLLNIKSLYGITPAINGGLICRNIGISNLNGMPSEIQGIVAIQNTELDSLDGMPEKYKRGEQTINWRGTTVKDGDDIISVSDLFNK